MVFSQTCLNTQRLLKLVEINRLKSEKNQQVNGLTGVTTGTRSANQSPSPSTPVSFSEEFLKSEQISQYTMLDSDCEFFQDLVQWCAAPAEEEVVQSIDYPKETEARAHYTDTSHITFSPQGQNVMDAISPSVHTFDHIPSFPASPTEDGMARFQTDFFNEQSTINNDSVPFQEQFIDFNALPVMIGELASDGAGASPWPAADCVWPPVDADYSKPTPTAHHTMPFIHQDDSMDMKFVSVIPREVESNDVIVTEFIINDDRVAAPDRGGGPARREALLLDVDAERVWGGDSISTPEVLNFVEQLETEKCPLTISHAATMPQQIFYPETTKIEESPPPTVDYSLPMTPKTEPESEEDIKPMKRKRQRSQDSEDSDETYTPYNEPPRTRKYVKKPKKNIKEMIQALEEVQHSVKKRGRPPGRRESTVSTVSNTSSVSTHEFKYRELRDKNNEASKRSRMNRKLKDLQMEQLAVELEERNKKLKVRADLLEGMTKKLRDAFMLAVSQKKVG